MKLKVKIVFERLVKCTNYGNKKGLLRLGDFIYGIQSPASGP